MLYMEEATRIGLMEEARAAQAIAEDTDGARLLSILERDVAGEEDIPLRRELKACWGRLSDKATGSDELFILTAVAHAFGYPGRSEELLGLVRDVRRDGIDAAWASELEKKGRKTA